MSITLGNLLDEGAIRKDDVPRLVSDSYSDVLLMAHPDSSLKLLSILKLELQERGITSLILLEHGLHGERMVSTVEYLSDGTVIMKADGDGRHLVVKRMIATPTELSWVQCRIRRGIEIRVAEFFE